MATQTKQVISVGVRELHNRTSELMQSVADGAELEVTKHGKVVGRMSPVEYDGLYERLKREGRILEPAPGARRRPLPAPVDIGPGKSVSDFLKEQKR